MQEFVIAIATKDKSPDDLILFGHKDSGRSDDDSAEESTIIERVDIFFDTIDDNVRQKSGSMLAKIAIKGKILGGLTAKFRKLSEWAYDRKAETQYRNICIGMRDANNQFHCVYSFKRVFVVDYREVYVLDEKNTEEDYDRFELYLTQEQGKMDLINILSDWPEDWNWVYKS